MLKRLKERLKGLRCRRNGPTVPKPDLVEVLLAQRAAAAEGVEPGPCTVDQLEYLDRLGLLLDRHNQLRQRSVGYRKSWLRSIAGLSATTSSKTTLQQAQNARFAAARWFVFFGVVVLAAGMFFAHCEAKAAFDFAMTTDGGTPSDYRFQVFVARLISITLMALGAVWFAVKSLSVSQSLFTPIDSGLSVDRQANPGHEPEPLVDGGRLLEAVASVMPSPSKEVVQAASEGLTPRQNP